MRLAVRGEFSCQLNLGRRLHRQGGRCWTTSRLCHGVNVPTTTQGCGNVQLAFSAFIDRVGGPPFDWFCILITKPTQRKIREQISSPAKAILSLSRSDPAASQQGQHGEPARGAWNPASHGRIHSFSLVFAVVIVWRVFYAPRDFRVNIQSAVNCEA